MIFAARRRGRRVEMPPVMVKVRPIWTLHFFGVVLAVVATLSGLVDAGTTSATGLTFTYDAVAHAHVGDHSLPVDGADSSAAPGGSARSDLRLDEGVALLRLAPDFVAPSQTGKFPSTADEMTDILGVDGVRTTTIQGTERTRWFPNDRTRITMDSHPLDTGYSPRHHDPHYHVQIRPDATTGWNNPAVEKLRPPGYTPGSGTGFIPGEAFPG